MKRIKLNKKDLLILFLMLITLATQLFLARLNQNQNEFADIQIGTVHLAVYSFKGILQAVISLFCVLITCIDYSKGRLFSTIMLGISIIAMMVLIIRLHDYTVIPGVIYSLLSLASIHIISRQFRNAELESITDDITKLYNRHGFVKELNRRIDRDKLGHIAYVQLINFRNINDNLGHEYGDMALQIVAERMKTIVGNRGVVCRLDGTEYAIAFSTGVDVETICNEIIDDISRKITLQKNGVSVNCYLNAVAGIASYPSDASDISTLMKYADIAMYHASIESKEKIRFFSDSLERESLEREEIQRKTKDSLENGYFYLVYQPQYELNTQKLRGFESLLRCKFPDGTCMMPGDFIPIAEKTDLIMSIDYYVLRRAMTEFKPLVDSTDKKFVLSINVSAKSMASADFTSRVLQIINETGYPADRLEIEITEYSFSESKELTFNNVTSLRKHGIMVAVDDFGTGYTSLEQLLKLPINLLKIDKSLIDDIVNSQMNRDFVDSVIYMGHLIGCEVISEGVENDEQLNLLREHKCDFIQGFVWSKPVSLEEAGNIVSA